jgi:hypothetical protein
MEDRIFGAKIDTSGGNVLTLTDMENTYLEHGVTYSVPYPISGIELLQIGRWELDAVKSITDKFATQGCVPTYISLDSVSSVLVVQFKFTGDYTKTILEAVSYIVTFGVTPLITLSKPYTMEILTSSTVIRDVPVGMIIGGAGLSLCIVGYVLLVKRRH